MDAQKREELMDAVMSRSREDFLLDCVEYAKVQAVDGIHVLGWRDPRFDRDFYDSLCEIEDLAIYAETLRRFEVPILTADDIPEMVTPTEFIADMDAKIDVMLAGEEAEMYDKKFRLSYDGKACEFLFDAEAFHRVSEFLEDILRKEVDDGDRPSLDLVGFMEHFLKLDI